MGCDEMLVDAAVGVRDQCVGEFDEIVCQRFDSGTAEQVGRIRQTKRVAARLHLQIETCCAGVDFFDLGAHSAQRGIRCGERIIVDGQRDGEDGVTTRP